MCKYWKRLILTRICIYDEIKVNEVTPCSGEAVVSLFRYQIGCSMVFRNFMIIC